LELPGGARRPGRFAVRHNLHAHVRRAGRHRQTYIWQDFDIAPKFPKLLHFLNFWAANLDGPLYRVRVAHRRLIAPQEFRFIDVELRLH
jgi:uncharacterized protein Usg